MIKAILFDFDGVILDSMDVREMGYRKIFPEHDPEAVNKLVAYHHMNGGISRFAKIRYFHETILGSTISEEEVNKLADRFSEIMRQNLTNPDRLIQETMDFIKTNHKKYDMHILAIDNDQEGQKASLLCKEISLAERIEIFF